MKLSIGALSFEDDITLHNRMLETMSKAMNERTPIQEYQMDKSKEAIKAIAELIAVKAAKQKFLIESSTVSCNSSMVEIS